MYKKSYSRAGGPLGAGLLMGVLFLGGPFTSPASGASGCPADIAGTQAYVECVVQRSGGGPVRGDVGRRTPEPVPVDATIGSADAWQLTVAGLAGLLLGVGATFGARAAAGHRHLHPAQ